MSRKFTPVIGLKITCSQCDKEFSATKNQQRLLFEQAPQACPGCDCMLYLPEDRLEDLKAKGNPGRPYMTAIGVAGGCGVAFFGGVLAGVIDYEPAISVGVVMFIITHLIITSAARSAISDLQVTMEKYNSP